MNRFGIDVETRAKPNLIRRLSGLKTTQSCEDGGMYHWDKSYSQVHVETTWTENELEDWLYRTKGIEYTGVFTLPPKSAVNN